jgi:2-keto-3-deoxy-L-fuconate dehydrogenase
MPVEGCLHQKRASITAAGAGISRATAEAFAREGCEVVATDLDPSKLAELAGAIHIADGGTSL